MINFETGKMELIGRVQPMWEQLNVHHNVVSKYFSDNFLNLTYVQRKQKFLEYGENIFIVIANENHKDIGYCVASVSDCEGRVDSIYADKSSRGHKIGSTLMTKALEWLETKNLSRIELVVAVGNEGVYKFYEQFGFFPRSTKLVKK